MTSGAQRYASAPPAACMLVTPLQFAGALTSPQQHGRWQRVHLLAQPEDRLGRSRPGWPREAQDEAEALAGSPS